MLRIGVSFVIASFYFSPFTWGNDVCTTIDPTSAQGSQIVDTVQELGRKISFAQWDKSSLLNVVLSPLSINIILNLLIAATGGGTNAEIKLFLGYPNELNECTIHRIFQQLLNYLELQSGNEIEISLYTKLFPQEEFTILDSYLTTSKTYYFSDVQNLDYLNSASDATDTINQWVFNSTKGKIEKLFDENLQSETVLVIVNVIFFNATWVNKFPSSDTENGTFETETGNIIIPMMTAIMEVPYLKDSTLGLEIVSLPYVGNQVSMYIVKPIESPSNNNLKELENKIDASQLNNLISQMQPTPLTVKIPRMKLDSDLDLKEDFMNFGVNKMFVSQAANFTRMSNKPNLYVSKIKHKAIIEVTEVGTVAAAVTGVVITTDSLPPPTFTLNKPSLLFIRGDNDLNLFYIRVMNPQPYW